MNRSLLRPKLFTTLKNYNRQQFIADLTAGCIVGIVALPLAIAFAIASGVSPDKGLITAIIAGFLISALGGSRVQIGGPTGAFVVIVYGIVQKYGVDGLMVATFMAGIILILMGLAGFGSMIKFIPYQVIVGFTSGIAVIIFTSQIKDFLGLQMGAVPTEFLEKWAAFARHAGSINPWALSISGACLLIITFWTKVSRKIPGSLVALIASTIVVRVFDLPVETIGSRFGEISPSLPSLSWPSIDYRTLRDLIGPATTIALLGGIESLLSAVVADGMIGGKHRSNMELVANGVANLVTPLFGGIPATGAIARTATNIKNGGRTPVAGMVHAVVLLLILLFFGKLASWIPMACLSAVLVVVAYHMSEWRTFGSLLKSPRSDVIVLLTTFGLTVLFDLTLAIEIGLVMSVFLFMRRMAQVTNVDIITKGMNDEGIEKDDPMALEKRTVPKGVAVYEINGPLFFGAAYKFEEAVGRVENRQEVLILRIRNVPAIDSTGLRMLRQVIDNCRRHKTAFILSGACPQPLRALRQSELDTVIGKENIAKNIDEALVRARELLGIQEHEKDMPIAALPKT